jgi:hypothetical protein
MKSTGKARTFTLGLLGALALATPALAPAGSADAALSTNAPLGAAAGKVKNGLLVLLTTRTVVPKVQRTVHFTGYATYTFAAPRGRKIVSASARILGAEAHAVAIGRRTVSMDRKRYTVKLVFPGEQGNPGKLRVTLGTVA